RWLLLKGQLNQQDHQQLMQATIDYLQTQTQQSDFLQVWQQTSQYTVFTAQTFAPQI
ncbi:MAG: 3'-5' exonuclease, partial [Pseudomonadota bacterium]|nr:3'-5' exonuclease [Pseudomonadota bacterium]